MNSSLNLQKIKLMSMCEDLTVAGMTFPQLDSEHFDRLPDCLLLLILNNVGNVKALGRCCLVSKRFHSLIPQVNNIIIRVDCVISNDDSSSSSSSSSKKSYSPFLKLFRSIFFNIFKPLHAFGQFLSPRRFSASTALSVGCSDGDKGVDIDGVPHHSPTQVLKNFDNIKYLRIELPNGELRIDDGVLLKWRADFGSTLDSCIILGASSVTSLYKPQQINKSVGNGGDPLHHDNSITVAALNDNGSIPESFYTNGGLKLRVVWSISSLIAASARHYLSQSIIVENQTLNNLVLTDADGQGVLCMNRDQLEEMRVKPLSASTASKRTLVPALNMRLWYASHLELPGGILLKGATLVVIRPSEHLGVTASKTDISDLSWVSNSFKESYGTAAKMLVKMRTYCLEMNSF